MSNYYKSPELIEELNRAYMGELKKLGIERGFEVLSEKYVGSVTKMKFKCLKDEYEWETTPNNIKNGHDCPKCVGLIHDKSYHVDIKDLIMCQI